MSDMSEKAMKKIGITGVMGAGKSSVIEMLKNAGYHVLDCDRINDELLMKGHAGYQALIAEFKDTICDAQGDVDRMKMSVLMFQEAGNKEKIEAILHPLIQARLQQELEQLQQETLVFVEVPLLYEVGWESCFDEVWVVAADEELLLKRLQQHRHVAKAEAKARLRKQLPQAVKVEKADRVLWNNGDQEELQSNIYAILKEAEGF